MGAPLWRWPMIVLEFIALTKTAAIRKAINYWYKNFYGIRNFLDFLDDCVLKRVDLNYYVIYRGPSPGDIDGY